MMELAGFRHFAVWDGPTRWFHWINVVCVIALAAIGTALLYDKELGVSDAGKILLKTTHVWFGYVFAVNLAWRIVWAFIGNRHALWSAIVPFKAGYLAELATYVRGLTRGDTARYLGHNPLARAMVTLLLALLFVQAVTGLVLAGTDIFYPPFGHWISAWIAAPGIDPSSVVPNDKTKIDPVAFAAMRSFRSPFVTIHYWIFNVLIAAIVLHIAGVIVTELKEGGGIVSAMFTGQKVFDQRPIDDTKPTD